MTKEQTSPFVAKEAKEAEQKENPNVALWDSVCKTDPVHTKKFSKGGGFSGTAIKPFWLMRRATETFGVCGIGWGWEEFENKMVAGVWCSKVRLWYEYNGKKGAIEQWGQTVMEGKNKNGPFVDEEAPKKAITDAVTKCLSYLGFAGDVHMGLFDDSKYIEERKSEESAASKKRMFSAIVKAIEESNDPAATWGEHLEEISKFKADETIGADSYDTLVRAGAKRKKELEQQAAITAGMPQDFNGVHQ